MNTDTIAPDPRKAQGREGELSADEILTAKMEELSREISEPGPAALLTASMIGFLKLKGARAYVRQMEGQS